MVVCCTGKHNNLNNRPLTVNDAIPVVELCTKYKDKAVFGVISSGLEEIEEYTDKDQLEQTEKTYRRRVHRSGMIVNLCPLDENDEKRLIINSGGEGMMCCCDLHGPIKVGDLICSSELAGYGCRQNDDIVHSYTIAKATGNSRDFYEGKGLLPVLYLL